MFKYWVPFGYVTCTSGSCAIFQEVKMRYMLWDILNLISFQGQTQGHHRYSSIGHLWHILDAPQISALFSTHFGCLWCTLFAPQVLVLFYCNFGCLWRTFIAPKVLMLFSFIMGASGVLWLRLRFLCYILTFCMQLSSMWKRASVNLSILAF